MAISAPASSAPDAAYNADKFIYDAQQDHYICPQGAVLITTGKFYPKQHKAGKQTLFKQYRSSACKFCVVKSSCTSSKRGRTLERNQHAHCYELNRKNLEENKELYKQRQAIVEHPFGTMKRQWGFDYILTKKGMQRASADVGLLFIAYNLRRLITIIGKNRIIEYLKVLLALFWAFWINKMPRRLHIHQKSDCRDTNYIFTDMNLFSMKFDLVKQFKLGF